MRPLVTLFAAMLGIAIVALAPLLVALRRRGQAPGRREAAIALHRAQLDEIARDLDEGRIDAESYRGARLEIERRVLAADAIGAEPKAAPDGRNAKALLIAVAVLVPVMAFALYLPGSTPDIPSEPHAAWILREQKEQQELATLIAALRKRIAGLDPASPLASEGEAYLAEALAEQAGQITPEALALFRQSYAHAPAGAPWRALDAERLTQAGVAPSSGS